MSTPQEALNGRTGDSRSGQSSTWQAGGFTLVELMVALMVVFVAMTVLAGIFVGSMRTLTVAKERQSATALGTRAMEQMRALPFSTITSGLSTTDLAGDANITGTPSTLKPALAPTVDEVLQTNTPATPPTATCATATSPLLPHRCTRRLDAVDYTVSSYVSQVPAVTPPQYSLTTIVTWTSSATRGSSKSVVNRSRAFSPNGTCTPANHPFNTPCQSQYHANAGLSEAGVTLSGATSGTPIATGFDVVSAQLSLPRMSATTSVEQTVHVTGATAAHSARIKGVSDELTSGQQALSGASTDPSNSTAPGPTAAAAVAGPLTRSGGGWTVAVIPETSGAWSTTSTASAGTTSGCEDSSGLAVDSTDQPCSSSRHQASSSARMTLTPGSIAARPLGAFDVADLGAPGALSRSFTSRFVAPRATWCPTASGTGCVVAGARRLLGSSTVGMLPAAGGSDVLPAGFTGAVRLDGYQATASAGSGTGAAAAAATRSGTLRTYNGSSYTTTDLATVTAPVTLGVSATGIYTTPTAAKVLVVISGQVKVTPRAFTPATCTATVCEATSGAVVANLTYSFFIDSTPHLQFSVSGDLGTLLATSTFKAA